MASEIDKETVKFITIPVDKYEELVGIVKGFAVMEPLDDEPGECVYCLSKESDLDKGLYPFPLLKHKEDCPWLAARKLYPNG